MVPAHQTKRCIVCCVEKEYENFYKKVSNLDGLDSRCKACEKKRHYEYNLDHADYPKTCNVCKETKTQKDFPKSSKSKDGLRSTCSHCYSLAAKLKNNTVNPEDSNKLKFCKGCCSQKPQSEFNRNKRSRDGLQFHCNTCRKKHRDSVNYLPDPTKKYEQKLCLTCNVIKTQDDFYTNNNLKDGLQTRCKECCIKFNHERNYTHDKSEVEYKKTCTKCNEKKLTSEFHRNKTQTSGLSSCCKDCASKSTLKYIKENPAKDAARAASRRARKVMATPRWAKTNTIDELYLEANELTKTTGVRHSVDHIVPLNSSIVCGLHCEDNLRIITLSENCSKGNHHWPDMP